MGIGIRIGGPTVFGKAEVVQNESRNVQKILAGIAWRSKRDWDPSYEEYNGTSSKRLKYGIS